MPITRLRANLQLKPDSVTSAEVKDASITKQDIAPGTLDGSVFADGSIPATKFDLSSFAGNGLVHNPVTHAIDLNLDTADLQIVADKLTLTSAVTIAGNDFGGAGQLLKADGSGNYGMGEAFPNSRLDLNGALTMRASTQPPVAPGASFVMYLDNGVNKIMVSKNGSSYSELQEGSNYVDLEEVTGPIDGVNAVFQLQYQPVAGSVHLFLNGVLLMPGAGKDYTISTNVITMFTVPSVGSRLVASYRK